MFEIHQTVHGSGMCLWTALAFLVLAIMIAVAIIHTYKQNRRNINFKKEMEDNRAERAAAQAAAMEASGQEV